MSICLYNNKKKWSTIVINLANSISPSLKAQIKPPSSQIFNLHHNITQYNANISFSHRDEIMSLYSVLLHSNLRGRGRKLLTDAAPVHAQCPVLRTPEPLARLHPITMYHVTSIRISLLRNMTILNLCLISQFKH